MATLHVRGPARAGSHRRWATGAVIVATLLAEVPRAPDHTADRPAGDAAAPARRGLARPAGTLAPVHRLALRHLIGV